MTRAVIFSVAQTSTIGADQARAGGGGGPVINEALSD